jgi:hypothetical protein
VSESEITAGKNHVGSTGDVWLYNRETGDFVRFRGGEADIIRKKKPAELVENDPGCVKTQPISRKRPN